MILLGRKTFLSASLSNFSMPVLFELSPSLSPSLSLPNHFFHTHPTRMASAVEATNSIEILEQEKVYWHRPCKYFFGGKEHTRQGNLLKRNTFSGVYKTSLQLIKNGDQLKIILQKHASSSVARRISMTNRFGLSSSSRNFPLLASIA
jgi:hypothetical protein